MSAALCRLKSCEHLLQTIITMPKTSLFICEAAFVRWQRPKIGIYFFLTVDLWKWNWENQFGRKITRLKCVLVAFYICNIKMYRRTWAIPFSTPEGWKRKRREKNINIFVHTHREMKRKKHFQSLKHWTVYNIFELRDYLSVMPPVAT